MTRSLTAFLVAAITLTSFCSPMYASQTLTLSLETPSLGGSPSISAPKSDEPAAKTTTGSSQAPKTNTVRVGKVGMVRVSTAYIYRSKSSRGSVYATVKSETPLAIVKEEGEWYGVLMTNGATGWIPRKNVSLTGYELLAKKPEISRGSSTSRGGNVSRGSYIADELIRTAMQYTGVSYVYGGTNPNGGMDCSAFVRMVFGQFGVNLPRTSREQAEVGVSVPVDQLQPGDRLYFACKNSHIDHCGIYAGNGYFVHCSASRNGVGMDSLASDFFWRSLVVAKRS